MRLKPKETKPSFATGVRKRLPSIAAAVMGIFFLTLLFKPAAAEEPGLKLALSLGWRSGPRTPCPNGKREHFHSYAYENSWGEFYASRAGEFLYPPNTNFGTEESDITQTPVHCAPVPAPSQIEEF